jgi:ribokinase
MDALRFAKASSRRMRFEGATVKKSIVILGVFVADTAYRADRQPKIGETILGKSFMLGPGGKGSNQAVAAGMLGANVSFLTRLGVDPFADMARGVWKSAGVKAFAIETPESYTGAAYIFLEEATGNNAIIVSPGAAGLISVADIDAHAEMITSAAIFMTQLEQPIETAIYALAMAKKAGITTILNPAPAAALPDSIYSLCDYITPNETEASDLTGVPVVSVEDARRAGDVFLAKGVGTALITLGEKGALFHSRGLSELVPGLNAGPVLETTGAGDAFNGGFASALANGMLPLQAARFACATAAISVTRKGTATSMPTLAEVETLLGGQ